jgi:hypothetical protein
VCHETLLKVAAVVGSGSKFASMVASACEAHVSVAFPCHPPVNVAANAEAATFDVPWREHGGNKYGARYRPTNP